MWGLLCFWLSLALAGGSKGNWVKNPSFEWGDKTSTYDWDLWGAGGDITEKTFLDSHSGQFCLRIIRHRPKDWAGASSISWNPQGVKRWFVFAYVRAKAKGENNFLYLRFWGDGGFFHQMGPRIPPATQGWERVYGFVATPPKANRMDFSVQIWSPPPTEVWIDDVFVTPADEPLPIEEYVKRANIYLKDITPTVIIPGTPCEGRYLKESKNTSSQPGVRRFSPKGQLLYQFPSNLLSSRALKTEFKGEVNLAIANKGKWLPIPPQAIKQEGGMKYATFSLERFPLQVALRVRLSSSRGGEIFKVDFFSEGVDLDMDGIKDSFERFLGVDLKEGSSKRITSPRTSFQTHLGYVPFHDISTDIVIIADNAPHKIHSWRGKGYIPYVMYGFRDGEDWVREHPEEVQTTEDGTKLTCGPGSYYLVPTENRVSKALDYFRKALEGGAKAVCPEEPEFFASAGYSDAFKHAFEKRYGKPWSPSQEPQNRWLWERLKGEMEINILSEIYKLARTYDPSVKTFLLAHSPLNYTESGIVFPHYQMLETGLVDEVIDQTWSDMIRGHTKYAGERKERLVENAYLYYASAVGYAHGKVKGLWFLHDPLADNPSLSIEEYERAYQANVVASLLFPQVSQYEVMPWPVRIFQHIPSWYEQEIMSVIQALSEMKDYDGQAEWFNPHGEVGVVMGDGAVYQRGGPYASDMDCFYGLMLPILYAGYALDIPHLERFTEVGYLDKYRVLLLSYDPQKPLSPDVNFALAEWVKKGGALILFGGDDPFNEVEEWWRKEGFPSPQDHLLSLLGIDVNTRKVWRAEEGDYKVALETSYKGRLGENRGWYEIDLTPYLARAGEVFVKFEDTIKGDGWGPALFKARIEGKRNGEPFVIEFTPKTEEEARYMFLDHGSSTFGELRFADGQSYWIYRFPLGRNVEAKVFLDIQNQFRVSVADSDPRALLAQLVPAGDNEIAKEVPVLPLSGGTSLTTYEVPEGQEIYKVPGNILPGKVSFHKEVGKGMIYFFGFTPAICARTPEGAKCLQRVVDCALKRFGKTLFSPGKMLLKRGPYIICKSFTEEVEFQGNLIDIFNPGIPLEKRHKVERGGWCLLRDMSDRMKGDGPTILWATSKLHWQESSSNLIRVLLSGPEATSARMRIFLGGKRLKKIEALNAKGEREEMDYEMDGETALLKYQNRADGIAMKIYFEGGKQR